MEVELEKYLMIYWHERKKRENADQINCLWTYFTDEL